MTSNRGIVRRIREFYGGARWAGAGRMIAFLRAIRWVTRGRI